MVRLVSALACLLIAFSIPQAPESAQGGLLKGLQVVTRVQSSTHAENRVDPKTGLEVPFKDAQPGFDGLDHWAFDPETGMIAGVSSSKRLLKVFKKLAPDLSGELHNQAKTILDPSQIVFKRTETKSYFVVLSAQRKRVQVFDAETLKSLKTFIYMDAGPAHMIAPAAKDISFLYLGTENWGARDEVYVGRINLDTLEEEEIKGKDAERLRKGAVIAPDGRKFYAEVPESRTPGVGLFEILKPSEGTFASKLVRKAYKAGWQPLKLGPKAAYVYLGQRRFTASLERELPKLDEYPSVFLRDRAYALKSEHGMRRSLELISLNSGKVETFESKAFGRGFGGQGEIFHHVAGNCLIVLNGAKTTIINLEALEVPKMPMLGFTIKGRRICDIGKKSEFTIESIEEPGKLEILTGPPGMVIEGTQLHWTPSEAQLGAFRLKIRHTKEGEGYEQTISLMASMPSLELPIDEAIETFQTPEGRYLVIHGMAKKGNGYRFYASTVDLKDFKVLKTSELGSTSGQLTISDQYIAYAKYKAREIRILDILTHEVKRVLKAQVEYGDMQFLANKYLYSSTKQSKGKRHVLFLLPDFIPVEEGLLYDFSRRGNYIGGRSQAFHDGLVSSRYPFYFGDGRILDKESEKIRALTNAGGAFTIRSGDPDEEYCKKPPHKRTRYSMNGASAIPAVAQPWGRFVGQNGLYSSRELIYEKTRGFAGASLPKQPIGVVASFEPFDKETRLINLDFYALASGKKIMSRKIGAIKHFESRRLRNNDDRRALRFYEDKIFVVESASILAFDLPTIEKKHAPVPLGFTLDEGYAIVRLKGESSKSLDLALRGNTKGLKLTYPAPFKGISTNKTRPLLIFAKEKLVAEAERMMLSYAKNFSGAESKAPSPKRVRSNYDSILSVFQEMKTKAFAFVPDVEEGNIIIPVYFEIEARNADKERAYRAITILVEVELATFKKAFDESHAKAVEVRKAYDEKIKKEREEAAKKRKERRRRR